MKRTVTGKYKYQVRVYLKDELDNDYFTGEFWANTKEEAIKDAQEFYAHENDTIPDKIGIENIIAI